MAPLCIWPLFYSLDHPSLQRFQTAQRTHMDKLQKFVDLFQRKMAGLEGEFERDLKALKGEFSTERFANNLTLKK